MYDNTSNNWSHWDSNEKLKEKFGSCTRKTVNRFTTQDSCTWNITHNTESTAVWRLKTERWGSPLVQEKYQEEKACDKRHNNNNNNNNNIIHWRILSRSLNLSANSWKGNSKKRFLHNTPLYLIFIILGLFNRNELSSKFRKIIANFFYWCYIRSVIRNSSVVKATTLRAGRSGDRIPVCTRFPPAVQNVPEAYPASCTMALFPGGKSARGWLWPLTLICCRC